MNLPINKCPYCGCSIFYRKDYMNGPSWYLASNVQEVDNGGMYDQSEASSWEMVVLHGL